MQEAQQAASAGGAADEVAQYAARAARLDVQDKVWGLSSPNCCCW
jgi:hypothetical protein